jgi:predicted  nucleic acid-binding Zn-ribbon protein
MSDEESWECRECKNVKPRSDFYAGRKKCKSCVKAMGRDAHHRKRENFEKIEKLNKKVGKLESKIEKFQEKVEELENTIERLRNDRSKLKEALKKIQPNYLDEIKLTPTVIEWGDWHRKKQHTEKNIEEICEGFRYITLLKKSNNIIDFEFPDKEV